MGNLKKFGSRTRGGGKKAPRGAGDFGGRGFSGKHKKGIKIISRIKKQKLKPKNNNKSISLSEFLKNFEIFPLKNIKFKIYKNMALTEQIKKKLGQISSENLVKQLKQYGTK